VYLWIESKVLSTGGSMKTCPKCNQKKKISDFYIRKDRESKKPQSFCKQCNHDNVLLRQRAFKLKCLEYKGKSCIKCGYSKCVAALEFHHTDPIQKDFIPSKFRHTSWEKNKDVIIKELDKCIVLCANCHREEHNSY
jgi:hypothetical protein